MLFLLRLEFDAELLNYLLKTGWPLLYNPQPQTTEVINLVKIEGTLDEIRELVGDVKRTVRDVKSTSKKAAKAATKTRRKLSAWQRYIKNKANHIKFKRGDKKGRLDLKRMSAAFKRSRKK